MGATRNTGYLENLIQYDASDNVAIATSVNPSYKVTLGGNMLGTSAVFSSSNTATAFIPTGSTIPSNGMYLSAANTLNFATNSLNRLSISTSTITSTLAISGTSADFSGNVIAASSSGYFNVGTTTNSGFKTYIKGAASGLLLSAGTTSTDNALLVQNQAETTTLFNIKGNGAATFSSSVTTGGKYFASASVADNIIEVINSDTTNGYGLYVRAGGTAANRYVARFKNGADSDVMWIDKGGNVLIGKTTNAGGRLQVSNGTNTFNVDHNADGPYLTGATDNNVNYRRLSYDATEHVFLTSATERMRITSGGNVGIGTTSPGSKLDVYTGSGATLRVTSGGTNILNVGNYSAADGFREFLLVGSELSFYTGTAGGGSASERMRIGSDGAVQMKHTNSFATLRLGGGNGVGEGRIYLEYNGNSSYIDCFGDNTYKDLVISANNLKFNSAGSQRMIITSGGEVDVKNTLLIGTTINATQYISISENQIRRTGNGIFYINNSNTGNVSININGGETLVNGTNGYGRAVTNSSDERIKKNITIIENALDKVLNMNGVYYEFNSQNRLGVSVPSDNRRIGLIAQQIENILPEAVFTPKEPNQPKSIDYSGMVGLLVKAIQELNQKIQALENR